MGVDTEQKTVVKHVKTRDPSGMKEYWTKVRVPVLRPGETPPEPEAPPPPKVPAQRPSHVTHWKYIPPDPDN